MVKSMDLACISRTKLIEFSKAFGKMGSIAVKSNQNRLLFFFNDFNIYKNII